MTSAAARREKDADLGRFCVKGPDNCDAIAYRMRWAVFNLCPELESATNTIGTKHVQNWG